MPDANSHKPDSTKKRSWSLPYTAICVALLVMAFDGGTSAPALISALAIMLIAFAWTFRKSFTPAKPGVILALFLALSFLTVLPLPDSILRIAGKEASSHHSLARATLSESNRGELTEKAGWFQISRNCAGTMRAILLLATMLTGAALARSLPEHRRIPLLLIIGIALAVIGLLGLTSIHLLSQGKTFWWLLPVDHGKPVTLFVNRNHFGGTMALFATVMLGLTCRTFKERPVFCLLSAAAFLVLAGAAVGSMSRGASLSLACGLAVAIVINFKKRPLLLAVLLVSMGGAVAALLLAVDNEGKLRSRVASLSDPLATTSAQLRLDTWKGSLPILKHYPVFGTGMNGFRAVYPQHRASSTRKEPHNVENEYLQVPVETGAAGTLLLLAALFAFLKPLMTKSGRTDVLPVVFPGLAVVAAHAFVDFAVRVPFYGLLTAILVGLSISREHLAKSGMARLIAVSFILPIALIVILLSCVSPRKTFDLDAPNYLGSASPAELADAIESSPCYWQAYYNLGRAAAYRPDLRELAERNITRASDLTPLNYRILIELALLRLDIGDEDGATQAYLRAKKIRDWLKVQPLEELLRKENRPAAP